MMIYIDSGYKYKYYYVTPQPKDGMRQQNKTLPQALRTWSSAY